MLQVNSYFSKVYWGIGIFPSHLFSHFLLRKLIEDILLKYYHWGMSNWLDKKLDMGKKENTPQTADTMLVGIWLFICASLWQLKHPRNNQTAIPACKLCCKGAFTNYVDNILPIIDHLPTPCWHLWRNYFSKISENLHTAVISSVTYLPSLVNVVCEWALRVAHKPNHMDDYIFKAQQQSMVNCLLSRLVYIQSLALHAFSLSMQGLKVSKFQKQIFLLSFEPKKPTKLFFEFCPRL